MRMRKPSTGTMAIAGEAAVQRTFAPGGDGSSVVLGCVLDETLKGDVSVDH